MLFGNSNFTNIFFTVTATCLQIFIKIGDIMKIDLFFSKEKVQPIELVTENFAFFSIPQILCVIQRMTDKGPENVLPRGCLSNTFLHLLFGTKSTYETNYRHFLVTDRLCIIFSFLRTILVLILHRTKFRKIYFSIWRNTFLKLKLYGYILYMYVNLLVNFHQNRWHHENWPFLFQRKSSANWTRDRKFCTLSWIPDRTLHPRVRLWCTCLGIWFGTISTYRIKCHSYLTKDRPIKFSFSPHTTMVLILHRIRFRITLFFI